MRSREEFAGRQGNHRKVKVHMEDDTLDLDELNKTLYAHFGLAYFLAEAAFEGLVQVVATEGTFVTTGDIEERTKKWRTSTLGPLVVAAKESIPIEHHSDLDQVVERRNDLAHGYWFRNIHLVSTAQGHNQLVAGLEQDQALFQKFSEMTDEICDRRLRAQGLTQEQWEESYREASNGPPPAELSRPLPRTGVPMTIQKVWFVPAGNLVFEDDANSLWQVSERGLGWYTGPPAQPDWRPVKWSDRLPARVVGRPKNVCVWNYTLEFSTGVNVQMFLDETSNRPRMKVVFKGRR